MFKCVVCSGVLLAAVWAGGFSTLVARPAVGQQATTEPAATSAVVPASPLATAKTIQVTQTTRQLGHGDKPMPPIRTEIAIDRAGPMRIEQAVLLPDAAGDKLAPKKISLFVVNAKRQFEYDVDSNSYIRADAPKPGEAPQPKLVATYYQANVDWLLHPDHFPVAPGATVAVTRDAVDGRPAILTTSTSPARKTEEGTTMVNWNKVWVDAETGLTIRQMACFSVDGGPEQEAIRTDFTNWKIDQPIAPESLAWTPPEGAVVHVEPKLLPPGTVVPDFECVTSDGKTLRLSDLRGKAVVIDFWATWCGPCQAGMPNVERTYQECKDKGVAVVGICVWDEKDLFDKWVLKNVGSKYNFTIAFDPAGTNTKASIAAKLFHVRGIPTQYVIDKDGKVAAGYTGSYAVDNRAEAALFKLGIDIPKPDVITSP